MGKTEAHEMSELDQLRQKIKDYRPGCYSSDKKVKKKAPPILRIAVVGPKGAGKSACINTALSSYSNQEPILKAPTQSSGEHGTKSPEDYDLTSFIKLCDFRGYDYVDNETEKWETRKQIDGKLTLGKQLIRRNDKEYTKWTPFNQFISTLFSKTEQCHAVLILIPVDVVTSNWSPLKSTVEMLTKEKRIKPLVVLTRMDKVSPTRVLEMRKLLSNTLSLDKSHIVAVENYHFNEKDDPLEGLPRDSDIEKRMLKLISIALQLGDDHLKVVC